MDSTLVAIETLDEMAALMGRGAEVAAITEAAMRGEISDYKQSLRERVALLAGMPQALADQVYDERLTLNPGAEELIGACKRAGLYCLLATGGFTCYTDRLRQRLGLDDARQRAGDARRRLTGRLLPQPWGDICDGEEKKNKLLEVCARLGVAPEQAIAVGDGANDLPMMRAAGLSVGFHPKPAVARGRRDHRGRRAGPPAATVHAGRGVRGQAPGRRGSGQSVDARVRIDRRFVVHALDLEAEQAQEVGLVAGEVRQFVDVVGLDLVPQFLHAPCTAGASSQSSTRSRPSSRSGGAADAIAVQAVDLFDAALVRAFGLHDLEQQRQVQRHHGDGRAGLRDHGLEHRHAGVAAARRQLARMSSTLRSRSFLAAPMEPFQ